MKISILNSSSSVQTYNPYLRKKTFNSPTEVVIDLRPNGTMCRLLPTDKDVCVKLTPAPDLHLPKDVSSSLDGLFITFNREETLLESRKKPLKLIPKPQAGKYFCSTELIQPNSQFSLKGKSHQLIIGDSHWIDLALVNRGWDGKVTSRKLTYNFHSGQSSPLLSFLRHKDFVAPPNGKHRTPNVSWDTLQKDWQTGSIFAKNVYRYNHSPDGHFCDLYVCLGEKQGSILQGSLILLKPGKADASGESISFSQIKEQDLSEQKIDADSIYPSEHIFKYVTPVNVGSEGNQVYGLENAYYFGVLNPRTGETYFVRKSFLPTSIATDKRVLYLGNDVPRCAKVDQLPIDVPPFYLTPFANHLTLSVLPEKGKKPKPFILIKHSKKYVIENTGQKPSLDTRFWPPELDMYRGKKGAKAVLPYKCDSFFPTENSQTHMFFRPKNFTKRPDGIHRVYIATSSATCQEFFTIVTLPGGYRMEPHYLMYELMAKLVVDT